jgi:hypothetical protein
VPGLARARGEASGSREVRGSAGQDRGECDCAEDHGRPSNPRTSETVDHRLTPLPYSDDNQTTPVMADGSRGSHLAKVFDSPWGHGRDIVRKTSQYLLTAQWFAPRHTAG